MDIIINPNVERLMGEIKNLKERLLELIEERDELLFQICPNIEAEYMGLLGALEYEALELEEKIRELKRKIEIIREKIAKQEPVILHEIEAQIEEEYKKYAENLLSFKNDLNEASARLNSEKLSSEHTKELKKIYHKIAKQLHPDLNENLTDDQKQLFFKAAEAYKTGDLTLMRMLDVVTEGVDVSAEIPKENAVENLEKRRDKIRLDVDMMKELIRNIKGSYPYKYKEIIEDKQKVCEMQEKLRNIIGTYKAVYEEYEKEYLDFFPENA